MAEKYPEVVEIEDEELLSGPINKRQAEDYADGLEKIIGGFHQLLNEDRKDALPVTIQLLKRHTGSMFEKMKMADVDMVIACIKDPNCAYLWEMLQMDMVQDVDPNEEPPLGEEILWKLPPLKHYTSER